MANIAITSYCNLRCPYCFADDMIHEQSENISVDKFRSILQWLSKTPVHIGVIGGEPTIHPYFSDILREVNLYCKELNQSATLFTNGIHLDKFVPDIGQAVGVLININSPDNMDPKQWSSINDTMEHLSLLSWFAPEHAKASIGCNLYAERTDYQFIWDMVDRFNLPGVRISVTAPVTEEYKANKELYYTKMKPIFIEFVKQADLRKIQLGSDCNQIPDCYFSRDELDLIYRICTNRKNSICEPVVDIMPDFTATACFGCYDPVDCSQFETAIDLQRYLLHRRTYPRVQANCTGKCVGCKNHELLTCQGGCLAFAQMGD